MFASLTYTFFWVLLLSNIDHRVHQYGGYLHVPVHIHDPSVHVHVCACSSIMWIQKMLLKVQPSDASELSSPLYLESEHSCDSLKNRWKLDTFQMEGLGFNKVTLWGGGK